MRIPFWDAVAVAASLYKGGNGEKGPSIFRHLKRDWHCRSDEASQALKEYGFRTGKGSKGDYWVSDHSSFFPEPMKPTQNKD